MAGQARWGGGNEQTMKTIGQSDLNFIMRDSSTGRDYDSPKTRPFTAVPSSNPQSGFHPSSFGPNLPFAAAALGASSSAGPSPLGMSISPPHWVPGNASWGASGSFGGSLGALGTSYGRERDREFEARFVKDFRCCGKQMNSLHELLEHYEEEHANLAPDIKLAAINAAQTSISPRSGALGSPLPGSASTDGGPHLLTPQPSLNTFHQQQLLQGDAPTPPGMMDIEMDEPRIVPESSSYLQMPQAASTQPAGFISSSSQSPWATAFRAQGTSTPPRGVTPSLLSFVPPSPGLQNGSLTQEQLESKALQKAQRKAERAAAREEASASDLEGEKRFPCPIAGCDKVYKQANGLKYHLTRSINSGHGNVAAMGGLSALLGVKAGDVGG